MGWTEHTHERRGHPTNTTILTSDALGPAIRALREGQVVAFPTETVYGLGADGLNDAACRRIFVAKGRPSDNPLILHVLGPEDLEGLVAELPVAAQRLIAAFWPGPLTVVVPATEKVPLSVRAGLDTVAVRAPSHPVARRLIAGLGSPIAAPSANLSGRPSPTTASAVYEDMRGRIPFIVDGGSAEVGLESTVVDCTTQPVTLLRAGGIGRGRLCDVVGEVVIATANSPVRSPGMKYRHYAPKSPLIWVQSTDDAFVRRILPDIVSAHRRWALIAPDVMKGLQASWFYGLGSDDVSAAHRLFDAMRTMDQHNPDAIVVIWESQGGLGLAISNRLEKASGRRVMPE
ncbi:MAG: threonylcarbamoyl-AMP synthase [Sulfobacillus acidophilus]|uniref:Threonylcarbamoyl-AMP synthase n=1 Tax=Sulfobacillus acidophilus TaxID=53633 RepID=A0A2T2WEE7_9FIRM|nr:MAG: threonylcarbamoyl-AMP synthase [Sulfobacillus acidophilus]